MPGIRLRLPTGHCLQTNGVSKQVALTPSTIVIGPIIPSMEIGNTVSLCSINSLMQHATANYYCKLSISYRGPTSTRGRHRWWPHNTRYNINIIKSSVCLAILALPGCSVLNLPSWTLVSSSVMKTEVGWCRRSLANALRIRSNWVRPNIRVPTQFGATNSLIFPW